MDQNGKLLYPTFLALSKAVDEWDQGKPAFKTKNRVIRHALITDEQVRQRIQGSEDEGEREALEEFLAARAARAKMTAKLNEDRRKAQEEQENFETAQREGNIADCGCCYVEYPLNRMVHCDGQVLHVSGPLLLFTC